jgi:predicted O-methyltransferase YrrM
LTEEGYVLAALARLADGPILEIGTALGCSTRFLQQATEQPIVTFDPRPQVTFRGGQIHQELRMSSEVPDLYKKGHFKMAFIDGDHSEEGVYGDLQRCVELAIPVVVCHDASGEYWPGVPRAIKKFDGVYRWVYLPTGCGLAVGRLMNESRNDH